MMHKKIAIKFSLDGEIRRILVETTDVRVGFFEKIKSKFRELFSPRLDNVSFNLTWTDEDADQISISTDAEFYDAMDSSFLSQSCDRTLLSIKFSVVPICSSGGGISHSEKHSLALIPTIKEQNLISKQKGFPFTIFDVFERNLLRRVPKLDRKNKLILQLIPPSPKRSFQKIEARHFASNEWLPGRVWLDRGKGLFDVEFDNGEFELFVKLRNIRAVDCHFAHHLDSLALAERILKVEDRVEIWHYQPESREFGTITEVDVVVPSDPGRKNFWVQTDAGHCLLGYSSGYHVFLVPRGPVSPGVAHDSNGHSVVVGSKVMINYRGRGEDDLRPATVMFVRHNGTIDVDYEAGGFELQVAQYKVHLSGSTVCQDIVKLAPGLRVEVEYVINGQPTLRMGTIVHSQWFVEDHYYVSFDSNPVNHVLIPEARIRPASQASGVRYARGMKVEGNFRCAGKWYTGIVRRVFGNHTVEIEYDDMPYERKVPLSRVRLPTSPPPPPPPPPPKTDVAVHSDSSHVMSLFEWCSTESTVLGAIDELSGVAIQRAADKLQLQQDIQRQQEHFAAMQKKLEEMSSQECGFPGDKTVSSSAEKQKGNDYKSLFDETNDVFPIEEESHTAAWTKQCTHCGRGFSCASYDKHIKSCVKVFGTKRRVFDSKRMRQGHNQLPARPRAGEV